MASRGWHYRPLADLSHISSTWPLLLSRFANSWNPGPRDGGIGRPARKMFLTPYSSTGFRLIPDMKTNSLTIGRLAREAGVNLETVRYYERRGLLPRPPRSASGYRLFPVEAARRLRFIRHAQELGFSLAEIRDLLSLRVSPTAKRTDVRRRADAKIANIEAKIRSLESMKRTLRNLVNTCHGCGPVAECPILESLDRESA